ncbi:hypothetical protein D8Y22_05495 [Salinadaptatus halalkaliphilus]|uniref:Uncharacterized protein n=1 Tax=Salinadaptatus halalkaliphilus TaxID=2419781 RepID=A0A4S3TNF2_9EURY|nr:hypothetical protein [Salinadaptatus halalkaliphilus]THE65839.1 hypothetical protein D8Y22_05495 [Salinadaptatus halalkaliphilus]
MSRNTDSEFEMDAQTTKYSVESTSHDGEVLEAADVDEPVTADEPSPEQNVTADYDEIANLPRTSFGRTINARAWHPSWGPTPAGYDNVVPRTQAVVSADTDVKLGETDDGQALKQSVRSIRQGNYSNTPDGMGATVGSGWTYDIPDYQLMERELAGHGVELSGSPSARVEAAHAEQREEEFQRAQIPTQQDVHEHYSVDMTEGVSGDERAFTIGDEFAEELEEQTQWDLTEEAMMSMTEKWESVREYTIDCADRRARESREAVAEMGVTNTATRDFERFTDDGDRAPEAEMAGEQAADHRNYHARFTRTRYPEGRCPAWPEGEAETETIDLGGETVEVATEPIAPASAEELKWAAEQARIECLPEWLLEKVERGAMRLWDRNAECVGVDAENTFYADLSDELEDGEEHPANEEAPAFVTADGRIPALSDSSAPGLPSVDRARTSFERALATEREYMYAFEPAMENLWHADGTQSLETIEPYWNGCSVKVEVTRSYVPNDPQSQNQILYVKDVTPTATGEGQLGEEAKLTVWRASNLDSRVAVGDTLYISNAKPGQYKNQLTLAATSDTTIEVVEAGDGPINTHRDALIGAISGANEAHRPEGDDHPPSVGGEIVEENPTKIFQKRHRPPEMTFQVGPPYEGKNTRVGRPMEERPVPMTWTYPITEWVDEHADVRSEEADGEVAPTVHEPDEVLEDDTTQITPDEFAQALATLDAEDSTPGGRYWEADDFGATVELLDDPEALGGIDEFVARIGHHPHAADELEIRVHSGIPLEEGEPKAIRIVEWHTEEDAPTAFRPKVHLTPGWEQRLVRKVQSLHGARHDPSRSLEAAKLKAATGADESGVPVVQPSAATESAGRSPSERPDWEPRRIFQNGSYLHECPVDSCEFSHPKKMRVVQHMGGKASGADDPHSAASEKAAAE